MRLAISLMRQAGVVERTGGPFGAVVVRAGVVLAAAGNSVLRDRDSTAHAEINAIRQACRAIGSHDLSGAVLYASGECCPMCYSRGTGPAFKRCISPPGGVTTPICLTTPAFRPT